MAQKLVPGTAIDNLDQIRRAVEDGAQEGLMEAARKVVLLARLYMPTHDPIRDPDPTINLAERIFLDVDPSGKMVEISVRAPHAAWHHENVRARHPRGGGAKFLEKALTDVIPDLQNIIAGEVRKEMQPYAKVPKSRRPR